MGVRLRDGARWLRRERLVAGGTAVLTLAAAGVAIWGATGRGDAQGPTAGSGPQKPNQVQIAGPPSSPSDLPQQSAIAEASGSLLLAQPGIAPDPTATAGSGTSNTPTQTSSPEPLICDGCAPPLKNHGGPVMGTRAHPGETTITPIYWKPAGYSFTTSYMSIVNTYIANVAAASGSDDNVYSVDTEYSNIDYLVHAGRAIVDGADFPAGCTPDPGYKACIEYSRVHERTQGLRRGQPPAGRPGAPLSRLPPEGGPGRDRARRGEVGFHLLRLSQRNEDGLGQSPDLRRRALRQRLPQRPSSKRGRSGRYPGGHAEPRDHRGHNGSDE